MTKNQYVFFLPRGGGGGRRSKRLLSLRNDACKPKTIKKCTKSLQVVKKNDFKTKNTPLKQRQRRGLNKESKEERIESGDGGKTGEIVSP